MSTFTKLLTLASAAALANAYWLMGGVNTLTTQRLDPIVNPGAISSHAHTVFGGSNFGMTTDTARLRQSQCTSIPIPEDKSNYWFPTLYFEWANGSFTSVNGGTVIYYLFDDKPGTTTPFPENFRMLSGDPMLRTYDPTSHAQQAVTFLCLNFNGGTTKHSEIPAKICPSGMRSQVNFQSCWDGKNTDSPDHKSHVAYQANGPDSGGCKDPKFPIAIPRIFNEIYWSTADFDNVRSQAKNPDQPFVFSNGDPTGYGYHGDFINGWDAGVLKKAVDGCNCNIYGDPTCCAQKGIFTLNHDKKCFITPTVDEPTTGTLPKLPGNNPVQPAGQRATMFPDNTNPSILSPVRVYTDPNSPPPKGQPGSNVRSSSAAAPTSTNVPTSSSVIAAPSTPATPVTSASHQPSSAASAVSSVSPVASPPSGITFIAVPSDGASSPAASSSAAASPVVPDHPYPYPVPSGADSPRPVASSPVVLPAPVTLSPSGSAAPGNPSPEPTYPSGSGSGSQHGSGAASSVVLVPVPAVTSAEPTNGNSSPTKNGAKCKHRNNGQKNVKQYIKSNHSEHASGHQHGKRVFSHDMSAGRRRFAQSRMLDV